MSREKRQASRTARKDSRQARKQDKKEARHSRKMERKDKRTMRKIERKFAKTDANIAKFEAKEDLKSQRTEAIGEAGMATIDMAKGVMTGAGFQDAISSIGMGIAGNLSGGSFQPSMKEYQGDDPKNIDLTQEIKKPENKNMLMIIVVAIIALFMFKKK